MEKKGKKIKTKIIEKKGQKWRKRQNKIKIKIIEKRVKNSDKTLEKRQKCIKSVEKVARNEEIKYCRKKGGKNEAKFFELCSNFLIFDFFLFFRFSSGGRSSSAGAAGASTWGRPAKTYNGCASSGRQLSP